ncbi:MAG: tRNA (adenosine(37)-N6)-threonylcarbamoyltransferase complex transferase subunit TsaD, partial [Bacilli bacterium]|nr:tRNA (adenosine(37)-N6)-threonylcarbamoyltransferase complex transferase subunit TsaD [Bacilli bacterium]
MKDIYCLAIESSCDETSMSIIKNGVEEICTVTNTQIDIHKVFGGVVPEVASRSHIENITIVLDELLERSKMKIDDIDIIGVTYGPGLIGSLLIGLQCAKTISLVTG